MQADAILLNRPHDIALARIALTDPGADDVVVAVTRTGISTGTERLLWSGRMPHFPGLGYPLVPGYEAVGTIVAAAPGSGLAVGARVFVPGAQCFGAVRGLFGAAASRLVVPAARVVPLDGAFGTVADEAAVLLALAATARHAIGAAALPELIVGHGVLGRLLARLTVAAGGRPVVWERNARRREGADGYAVLDPDDDARRDYAVIHDVSGDPGLLDTLIGRLARGGELVLAGFYPDRLGFAFPPAFMREIRMRVAAQWQQDDLLAVRDMAASGRLALDGLVSHRRAAHDAEAAYAQAFEDADCLKMTLDWRACA